VVVPAGLIVRDAAGTRAVLNAPFDPLNPAGVEAHLERRAAALVEPAGDAPSASSGWTVEPCEGDSAWCARVADAQAAMARAEFDKVVLATAVRYRATDGRPPSVIGTARTLRRRNPQAFCFAVAGENQHFVGASPELLVRVQRGELSTQALAGTTGRGSTRAEDVLLAQDLLADAKERLEHRLVVEGIRSALSPLCRNLQVPAEPAVVALPAVQHLNTAVCGTLRPDCDVLDALHALHPTAAVGGAPRREAQRWLRAEPFPRGWFASPVGVLDGAGGGTFAVAIRSVLVDADGAVAQAGAGILPASDPLGEWDEVQLKLHTSASALEVDG
jgi:isochorismate synthase